MLQATYGHQPVYFCRWDRAELVGLLAVMEVDSPWRGRRGVSLPFTDSCPPLGDAQAKGSLYQAALDYGRGRQWRFLESRGIGSGWPGAVVSIRFLGHSIDLAAGNWVGRFGASVSRGIRKAKASGLRVEFGASTEAMATFYRLHCQTRRRHGVPPQPWRFFENIARYVLEPGQGFVATAYHERSAVAAAVFLLHGQEAVYKFGASDQAFQQLRPNNLVMGEAIHRCAQEGCLRLHLGRTSVGNEGLRRFKLGFGAQEEEIHYAKFDFRAGAFVQDADRSSGWYNRVFRCLPVPVLRWAGAMLYPHLT